jgi:hypothetical protein
MYLGPHPSALVSNPAYQSNKSVKPATTATPCDSVEGPYISLASRNGIFGVPNPGSLASSSPVPANVPIPLQAQDDQYLSASQPGEGGPQFSQAETDLDIEQLSVWPDVTYVSWGDGADGSENVEGCHSPR